MTFHRWLFSLLSGRTLRAHLFFCLFTDTVVAPSQALGLVFFFPCKWKKETFTWGACSRNCKWWYCWSAYFSLPSNWESGRWCLRAFSTKERTYLIFLLRDLPWIVRYAPGGCLLGNGLHKHCISDSSKAGKLYIMFRKKQLMLSDIYVAWSCKLSCRLSLSLVHTSSDTY